MSGTIESWLRDGRASNLPPALSEAFDRHVALLPWAGTTGLDWSRMPPSRALSLTGVSAADVYRWGMTVGVGRHEHLAVWYSTLGGGVVVSLRAALVALDELYLHAPGPRFCFGIDVHDGDWRPAFADILQYGHADVLVATT